MVSNPIMRDLAIVLRYAHSAAMPLRAFTILDG